MTTIQIVASMKIAAYCIPLALLVRKAKWRWLIAALILGAVGNVSVALAAPRLTSSLIGLVFLATLTVHAFDVSKYGKPE